MARPKKPPEQLMETVGVKLIPTKVEALETIAARYNKNKSWAAREMIELGLRVYELMESLGSEVRLPVSDPRAASTRNVTQIVEITHDPRYSVVEVRPKFVPEKK